MRDTNARTEHSRELRKETSAKRRARILDQGGLDFRALIEREHAEMLDALVAHAKARDDKETKTSVFRVLLEKAYWQLQRESNKTDLDQLDIVRDQLNKPATEVKPAGAPPTKYTLDGQCWSGRGRKPMWVIEYLESGGNLEDIETDWRKKK